MDAELLLKRHDLLANQALLDFITSRYGELGIHSPPANLKNDELVKYFIGEYYALLTKQLGERAAELLFQARWNAYSHPEWFDHRLSDLSDKYNTDYVALSGVHALLCMPLSGKVLSLCSGDGYYEYHYYSYRADHVDCLEIDADAFSHACIYHKKKNISYINANILDANFGENVYDVVVIRGAIEHFSADNQHLIFCKSNRALKEGGIFCGDTVQKIENVCQLKEHKCEWENEEAMRKALAAVFEDITTYSFESKKGDHDVKGRVTLLWSCRKHMNSI